MPSRVRESFAVDETIVAALAETEFSAGSSQSRYVAWRRSIAADRAGVVEFLVPRVVVEIPAARPEFMSPRPDAEVAKDALAARVEELGPWEVPFHLGHGVRTMPKNLATGVAAKWYWYRTHLINGAVARLLGADLERTTVLDIGCHSGLFSLDLATRGAAHVDGIDLRPQNIAQARFAAEYYGIDNVSFEVRDVDDVASDGQWDVVLNLGVLYHVLNPFELIEKTHALCRSFAVIDTVCHTEPVSAFFVMGDKNVHSTTEGKGAYELHPTYRAVIDTMRQVGFSEIFEVRGRAAEQHDLYAAGSRRCFLAIK
jgi:2-polyprenyl-3-methyl-5-hydroxy-6-metoxy-1,4-benzoquinol methylase